MSKITRYLTISLILVVTLAACNLPSGAQPTNDPNAVFTAAAQTVEAQLTRSAPLNTPTSVVILATETPGPTSTTAAPTTTTTVLPASPTALCDAAKFVSDVTIPDGTNLVPNTPFTKTWRLQNVGTCTWTSAYAIVFDSGNAMSGPAAQNMPGNVPPGSTVDITVNLVAPAATGNYTSNWKLRNSSGVIFGIGPAANASFWVKIQVSGTSSSSIAYDFVVNYCSAQWISGAGNLPCPGTDTDNRGFVIKLNTPRLETGEIDNDAALWAHPEWIDNGVISGRYPPFNVQSGDRFEAVIGCLYNGLACNVRFQLNYRADGGSLQNLGQWDEVYDNRIQYLNVDLTPLAGKSVEFILAVLANGPSNQDWAFWVTPRIYR